MIRRRKRSPKITPLPPQGVTRRIGRVVVRLHADGLDVRAVGGRRWVRIPHRNWAKAAALPGCELIERRDRRDADPRTDPVVLRVFAGDDAPREPVERIDAATDGLTAAEWADPFAALGIVFGPAGETQRPGDHGAPVPKEEERQSGRRRRQS